MPEPAYAPALAAAAIMQQFYAHQPAAAAPDPQTVSAVVNAAFWASLRREEGRSPKISVAMVPPGMTGQPMTFERSLALDADVLVRLGPAVEGPGIHVGAWPADDGRLRIWGAARDLPDLCLVAEVVEPGLLVLKYQRHRDQKFGNLAVLLGDQVRVVEEGDGVMPGRPALLSALLGTESIIPWTEGGSLFTQLAVAMRRHRHGAALLVVPSGTDAWRASIAQPAVYSMVPPFRALAERLERAAQEADGDDVRELVDAIAGLTAVDGAAVLTHRFELLAFGATIRRRDGCPSVEEVIVTEPVVGDVPLRVPATELGGTRHLSAAQFVHDQRDALAFVASQDGRFTVFAWSPTKQRVHGHRIEVLLL
jgi:sensor domain DACNV-containing protein